MKQAKIFNGTLDVIIKKMAEAQNSRMHLAVVQFHDEYSNGYDTFARLEYDYRTMWGNFAEFASRVFAILNEYEEDDYDGTVTITIAINNDINHPITIEVNKSTDIITSECEIDGVLYWDSTKELSDRAYGGWNAVAREIVNSIINALMMNMREGNK